ncbi:hypothetical protein [Neisseria musculi]|uniref:hypothetical protein n=1 Tax=Neisseria musculi TaxID=1815583 RepID=UPI00361E75FB
MMQTIEKTLQHRRPCRLPPNNENRRVQGSLWLMRCSKPLGPSENIFSDGPNDAETQ